MKKYLILFLLFFLTGCSYKELNELAIASSLGIDYENGIYTVSAQILDLKKEKDDTSSSTLIYEGSGNTISSAVRNIGLKYPKTLYLGHLELVVIGKGEVEHGISNTFDYFIRTAETRSDSYIIVSTKNTAFEILNPNEEENEDMPAKNIITTLKNSMDRNGKAVMKNLEEFITNYMEEGIDPITSEITLTKQENKNYKDTTLNQVAIFKDGKYLNTLTDDLIIAYNIINNNFYDITITSTYKNNNVSVALLNPKSNIDLKIDNNNLTFNINLNLEGTILEFLDKENLTSGNTIDIIEDNTNKIIEDYVNSLIKFSSSNNCDILGLKNMIYKKYYKKYNNYKDKNIYEEATFNIKSNLTIYRHGAIHSGFIKGENYE